MSAISSSAPREQRREVCIVILLFVHICARLGMDYMAGNFVWDLEKERLNIEKHGVDIDGSVHPSGSIDQDLRRRLLEQREARV